MSEYHMDRITRAKFFAERAHAGQVYNEELPYTAHLQMVFDVAKRFGVEDEDVYCACYLHDTIEDTRTSYNDIVGRFGERVAELVFAVTNEMGRNRKERAAKTYPKLANAGTDALLLKLCDRIANVEYGLAGDGKTEMYRLEFEGFAECLYVELPKSAPDSKPTRNAVILNCMWQHIARLLDCQLPDRPVKDFMAKVKSRGAS